ncbi:NAD(P)H-binding protein [Bacillus sp. H-16]|uniref:NAD(P)-dependent oxidoreductase n=1 Tax=Alteribacter salitolerans TaxID=2912333 RepID=UPI0019638B1F|nr:NAD(P)H-binding protein [Alteribacter salitolerans]MBM7097394.1 NAD(P)H-binding protein [Alteribacter salitolerans]
MNILLFGATGRVGNHLIKLAAESSHLYTLFVRSPAKLASPLPPNMRLFQGNAVEKRDVHKALQGQDGVISCLSTDKNNVLSAFTPILCEGMAEQGIKRVITVGTAGILQSRSEPGTFRFLSKESKRKTTIAAQDHLSVYNTFRKTNLDWTIICPTYLPEGEITGLARYEKDMLPIDGSRVTTGDTAAFTYHEFFNQAFVRTRVGLAE